MCEVHDEKLGNWALDSSAAIVSSPHLLHLYRHRLIILSVNKKDFINKLGAPRVISELWTFPHSSASNDVAGCGEEREERITKKILLFWSERFRTNILQLLLTNKLMQHEWTISWENSKSHWK